MKVLVTGGSGFVGSHLVPRLLDRGHAVTVVARDTARARASPWFDRVAFVASDLHAVEDPVAALGVPDVLVHLAWPGLPNYDGLFHLEENLPRAYRLVRDLVVAGTARVLVTGTCFEYGQASGPLAEDAPTNPTNPYGLAKDTLRRFLVHLQATRPFVLQWARLFYMHGPGQNPRSVLAQLDAAIDRGDLAFPMSGGEQLRDYLPVEAVADDLATLVDDPSMHGIVNVCRGEPISVRRLVEERAAARGSAIRLELGRFPYSPFEPMAFWGQRGKLAKR